MVCAGGNLQCSYSRLECSGPKHTYKHSQLSSIRFTEEDEELQSKNMDVRGINKAEDR